MLEFLRARVPSLSASGRRIAETVLDDPERVLTMSAVRLGEASGSSVGSVVRFCHSLGIASFKDFKLRLAAQTGCPGCRCARVPAGSPAGRDTIDDVFAITMDGLSRAIDSVDRAAITRAAVAMRTARRILIPSSGSSQPVATALGAWLSWSGSSVAYPTDAPGRGWRLTGPGVPAGEPVHLEVTGLGDRFLAARADLVGDYPTGIDVLFVTDAGTVAGIPRTTRIEVA